MKDKIQDTHDKDCLLTRNELARRLGVCARTVQRLTAEGIVPCILVRPRMPRYDLDAVLSALQTSGEGEA